MNIAYFKKFSVGARTLLASTVAFAIIGICAWRMMVNLERLAETQQWVAHTNEVVATTKQALSALVDIETGSRGFAVGGDERFLEPYNAGIQAFKTHLDKALGLVADNPEQVARFNKLGAAQKTWVEGPVAQEISTRKAVTAGTVAVEQFVTLFNEAKGKAGMDAMRGLTAEIVGIEEALMASRVESYGKAVAESRIWGTWGIAGAVFLGWGLLFWINHTVRKALSDVATNLRDVADQVAAASRQVSGASQALAEGASEQAASLEETSASLEEINSMARRNAEGAHNVQELAKDTRDTTTLGSQQMKEMVNAMGTIKASSDNIAKIVKSIDEIAFQTNILALNAAVEAARAGEAGAGFAVAADEVRALAQRAAQAAKETAEKIEDSIAKSSYGVDLSGKVAHSLSQIEERASKMNELISEIAAASGEQTQGIGQVSTAVTQMDKVTQGSAASAEETASAAEELNSQASVLVDNVERLSRLVLGESKQASKAPAASAPNAGPSAGRQTRRVMRTSAKREIEEASFR
jgi:CHASE3 domain sensor protein